MPTIKVNKAEKQEKPKPTAKNTTCTQVRITPELHSRIKVYAAANGMKMIEFFENACEMYLQAQEKDGKTKTKQA